MPFNKLNIIEPIVKALQSKGYTTPTAIQTQAIPVVLEGKDLLGSAQTGTGKTAAFAIPVLQLLHSTRHATPKPRPIRALVLTPTRELAIQVEESFKAYGKHTGLYHTVIYGGVPQRKQTDALRRGVDILVATPGRLLDLMDQKFVHLDKVELFVLDEADRMLDMGFMKDLKRIIPKLPEKRQTLFFSATMPPEIQDLANSILKNPIRIAVAPTSSAADSVKQSVFYVEKENKKSLLIHLMEEKAMDRVLVFTRTKRGAERLVNDLQKSGINSDAIHGDKSQGARQRALNQFKNGRVKVLVATDIAARGIDVDHLPFVINYDLPNEAETYIHRIGRTGRGGNFGEALSFCDREEWGYLKDITRLLKKEIPLIEEHPYPGPAPKASVRTEDGAAKSSNGRSGKNRKSGGKGGNRRNNDRRGPSSFSRSRNKSGEFSDRKGGVKQGRQGGASKEKVPSAKAASQASSPKADASSDKKKGRGNFIAKLKSKFDFGFGDLTY